MQTKRREKTRMLVEGALLIALATVLSELPLLKMSYGGSITVASMFPILLISYRHGVGRGLFAATAFAVIQQILGLSNLSYFTTWQSIVAVILLDYLLAFTVIGLGGAFRRFPIQQSVQLATGAVFACLLRYICHVISGATVWAGLSIPTTAVLVYSLGYNATYMLPETIVLTATAFYLGSLLDFRCKEVKRLPAARRTPAADGCLVAGGALLLGGLIFDTIRIFFELQDPETGAFTLTNLTAAPFAESVWPMVLIVTAATALPAIALFHVRHFLLKKRNNASTRFSA